MGSKKNSTTPMAPIRKIGMWSTISDAVQSGWGAAARLIAVIATVGIVTTFLALATGGGGIGLLLRTLLDIRF